VVFILGRLQYTSPAFGEPRRSSMALRSVCSLLDPDKCCH
jgi:hypothetical protein